MACDCTTYECLGVVQSYDNCATTITLELESLDTGSYNWSYEFNGRWFGGNVEVTEGDNIILPWVFNENYVHKIKFFRPSGELLNDTCYKLNTSEIAGSFITPSSDAGSKYLNVELTADMLSDGGATVTIPSIAGKTLVSVLDGNQAYNFGSFNKAVGSDSFTMTNGTTFYVGQKITLEFA